MNPLSGTSPQFFFLSLIGGAAAVAARAMIFARLYVTIIIPLLGKRLSIVPQLLLRYNLIIRISQLVLGM